MNLTKEASKYLETYGGKELLKKHSLEETGFWRILGEDPNCDWGGSHYNPDLGTVEGRLGDVIEYGVRLPNFWAWGGGGEFKKVIMKPVKKVEDARREAARIAELKLKRAEIDAELKKLEG